MATRRMEAAPRLDRAIGAGARYLASRQREDGSFDEGFDGGALPDAHLVTTARLLGLPAPEPCRRLARRLLDRQLPEGGWALSPGSPGHLATSVESYIALRAAGLPDDDLALLRARRFIRAQGGLDSVRGPTRVTLALLGLTAWNELHIPPAEVALLPPRAPVSLFRVGALLRLHLLPLLVLKALEPRFGAELGLLLARELGALERPSPRAQRPGPLAHDALREVVRLVVERQDEDGTVGGLLMATGWAALAGRALGLPADHALGRRAVEGFLSLVHEGQSGRPHVQVCRATVRSTSEALAALRRAGADPRVVARARDALVLSRAGAHGDFELLGPEGPVAAWSIKPRSGRFPSLADTARAIEALSGLDGCDELLGRSWSWILAMQRPDGGFALFDRDAASAPWVEHLPLGLLCATLNDASSPEVTGQVLSLVGPMRQAGSERIDRACCFLARRQRSDGAWSGPFAASVLAPTASALAGLAACGRAGSTTAARAARFLVDTQRPDGGWGEAPHHGASSRYVDLGRSVPSQTAVALCGLLALPTREAMRAAQRAAEHLLWTQEPDGSWAEDDPAAAGLTDVLLLQNPIDRVARPLRALCEFGRAIGLPGERDRTS